MTYQYRAFIQSIIKPFLVFFMFSGQACATGHTQDVKPNQTTIPIPSDTSIVVIFDKNAKASRFFNGEGKELRPCNLCTQEILGKYEVETCKDLTPDLEKKLNICSSLTNATVERIDSAVITNSHKNPHCITFSMGGVSVAAPSPCTPH